MVSWTEQQPLPNDEWGCTSEAGEGAPKLSVEQVASSTLDPPDSPREESAVPDTPLPEAELSFFTSVPSSPVESGDAPPDITLKGTPEVNKAWLFRALNQCAHLDSSQETLNSSDGINETSGNSQASVTFGITASDGDDPADKRSELKGEVQLSSSADAPRRSFDGMHASKTSPALLTAPEGSTSRSADSSPRHPKSKRTSNISVQAIGRVDSDSMIYKVRRSKKKRSTASPEERSIWSALKSAVTGTAHRERSSTADSVSAIDVGTEDEYLYQAAAQISKAQQNEASGAYEAAFSLYKSGVQVLLRGVQDDQNKSRRDAVRRKLARYLLRAENIYNQHLSLQAQDDARWSHESKLSPMSCAEPSVLTLQCPRSELASFRVLGPCGASCMLALDSRTGTTCVIKSFRKVFHPGKTGRNIVPVQCPFMVNLVCFFETEEMLYLILQHATGGPLFDYVTRYTTQADEQACAQRVRVISGSDAINTMERSSFETSLSTNCSDAQQSKEQSDAEERPESRTTPSLPGATKSSSVQFGTDSVPDVLPSYADSVSESEVKHSVTSKYKLTSQLSKTGLFSDEEPISPSTADVSQSESAPLSLRCDKFEDILQQTTLQTGAFSICSLEESDEGEPTIRGNLAILESSGSSDPSQTDGKPASHSQLCHPQDETAAMLQNAEALLRRVTRTLSVSEDTAPSQQQLAAPPVKRASPVRPAPQRTVIRSRAASSSSIRVRRLPPELCRRWAAELVTAVCNLHSLGLIIRDLQPKNLLLGSGGQLMLSYCSSWSLADQRLDPQAQRLLYCAPELESVWGHSHACDWWSVGAVLYELLAELPLHVSHPTGILRHTTLWFPDQLSSEARSLLSQLLQVDPKERLGSGLGATDEIKAHPFFAGIDWNKLKSTVTWS